jgi:hypothetical protein
MTGRYSGWMPDVRLLEDLSLQGLPVEILTEGVAAEVRAHLEHVERLDFSVLSTRQLTELQVMMNQLRAFMPMLVMDVALNDLVRITINPRGADGLPMRIHNLLRLKYPPPEKARMRRANFRNCSVLYASCFGLTSTVETRVAPGDLITRTEWRMVTDLDRISTAVIFHEDTILQGLPLWRQYEEMYRREVAKRKPLEAELINVCSRFLARQFTKKVESGKEVNYLLSAFVGNLWLQQMNLGALMYPSVQVNLHDACVAMRADVFDDTFYPVKCTEALINSAPEEEPGHYYATKTGVATNIDVKTNAIHWDRKRSYDEQQLAAFQRYRAQERRQRAASQPQR